MAAEALTATQRQALWLHEHGINVGVQPIAAKKGFPARVLFFTRLPYDPVDRRPGDLLDVTSGRCNLSLVPGRTSGNLVIFDCETRPALIHMYRQFQARGMRLWVVQSPSRKGGGHIWVRCLDGEVENIKPGKHRDIEARANWCYVMAPPSIHPDPVDPARPYYTWFERDGDTVPEVRLADLDGITDLDGNPIKLRLKAAAPAGRSAWTPYSKATADYIARGHDLPEGSRYNSVMSAFMDFGRCDRKGYLGCSFDEAYALLAPVARASGLPDSEIDHAATAFFNAQGVTYKQKPLARWRLAEVFVEAFRFAGSTGASDERVMSAMVQRLRDDGDAQGTFRASEREIAELARLTRKSVRRARLRLQEAGLIARVEHDAKVKAGRETHSPALLHERRPSQWKFTDQVLKQGRALLRDKHGASTPLKSTTKDYRSSGVFAPFSDVPERGALGLSGIKILRAMQALGRATLRQIADQAGVTPDAVRYHLTGRTRGGGARSGGNLAALVHRQGRLYSIASVSDAEIERSVVPMGVAGKAERRRAQHERERALYAGLVIVRYREKHDRANYPGFQLESTVELEQFKDHILGRQHGADVVGADPNLGCTSGANSHGL